ncbi:hypothetical protein [Hymenobacter weizhouensis]|uniref:hypothetical protein n=1 Tax=Hymenobacter sp. YIM 151500-1 TaxID=2987689 RepID=UPI002226B43E|nr:hypothetical protein [Hymenobacter sp. YIM 151500-1]UYZ63364.1 hypothetical protein OIS53_00625 [Hymenobacter sp. YIM 151500-1]
MKHRLLLLCLSLLGLLHTACKKEGSDEVRIQVKNASGYRFERVYVDTSGGEKEYGSLAPSQKSDYATYTVAFNYAYIKVVVNGQELTWQPIDYVGETPLKPGKYTYVVGVQDLAAKRLSLTLDK